LPKKQNSNNNNNVEKAKCICVRGIEGLNSLPNNVIAVRWRKIFAGAHVQGPKLRC
jgi:hypothetical protein